MSDSFLSWVGHRLLPRLSQRGHYIYQNQEEITGIFFVKRGRVAFTIGKLMEHSPILKEYGEGDILGFEDFAYWRQQLNQTSSDDKIEEEEWNF